MLAKQVADVGEVRLLRSYPLNDFQSLLEVEMAQVGFLA